MKSRSQTKDHGHQSGNETSTQAKWPAAGTHGWHGYFPPRHWARLMKHYVGKALPTCSYSKNSLLTALVNCKARIVGCQYDSFLCLQLASRHDN